jgi:uncharacterized protein (DUF1015 family)
LEDNQGTLGLFAAGDQTWVIARITANGHRRMEELAADRSPDWRGLGVAVLHRLVVDTLLKASDLPEPKYVHLINDVVAELERGDEDGKAFPMAALVMPATLDHIQTISWHAERMPAKSTYFFPKLLSGLVINPLDG